MYSENALVTILMCSHIDAKKGGYKPFTALEWSNLVKKVITTELKEPSSLLKLSSNDLCDSLKISENEGERIKKLLSRGANMAFILEDLDKKGIKILTRSDDQYPSRLKSLLNKHAPPLFYYSGNLELLSYKSIAIVGSRNIDDEGNRFAYELAEKASQERIVVVSGGAKGVDTISEEAVLKNNGAAISIIADSLSRKIKRKSIRDAIVQGRLLVMSTTNPEAPFSAGSAMNRNKYVYILSMSAFIVASDFNKGGTWAGAVENMKNDWVKSFVFESEKYSGNMELIRRGAKPISNLNSTVLLDIISSNESDYKQVNVFELSEDVKEQKRKYNKVTPEGYQDMKEKRGYDLYFSFADSLEELLVEPKSLEEIMGFYNTNKSQTLIWLKRALADEIIIKKSKPVKYALKSER